MRRAVKVSPQLSHEIAQASTSRVVLFGFFMARTIPLR